MTTIVTGGLGFIGAHTVRAFAEAGEQVVATSYESHRVPSFLKQYVGVNVAIERCDVGEPGAIEALARKHGADGIVHLAIHRLASADPGEDLRINMDKLSRMLDGALAAGVRRVCWASNGAIFAELPEGPFHEETPVPLTGGVKPGAFKKGWEVLAYNYANNYGAETEVVSMRISGVFGPTYRSMLNLPSRLCHAASRGHEPDFSERFGGVPFAGDTFDLTYAPDVADAIRALQLAPSLAHRVYNVRARRDGHRCRAPRRRPRREVRVRRGAAGRGAAPATGPTPASPTSASPARPAGAPCTRSPAPSPTTSPGSTPGRSFRRCGGFQVLLRRSTT